MRSMSNRAETKTTGTNSSSR